MIAPFPWELPDHVQGIDISAAQWSLSREHWLAIAAAEIVTTSIKATDFTSDGRPFVDSMIDKHQESAIAVEQKIDFYAFLHSNLPGRTQAEHFARTVEKRPRHARWWADFEDAARITPDRRRAFDCLAAFMERGTELLGEPGGIYTGPGVMALLASLGPELDELARYDLWVAHYRIDPANGHDYGLLAPTIPKPWTKAVGWQVCGDRGVRIPGVPVDIDRDVFFGTRASFDAWCHRYDRHEPAPTQPDSPTVPFGWADRAELDARADTDPSELAPPIPSERVTTTPSTPAAKREPST